MVVTRRTVRRASFVAGVAAFFVCHELRTLLALARCQRFPKCGPRGLTSAVSPKYIGVATPCPIRAHTA